MWFGQQSLGAQVSLFWGQTKVLHLEYKKWQRTHDDVKVGACASPAAGKAMAEYYLSATLKADPGTAAAAYYYSGAEPTQEGTTSRAIAYGAGA